MIQSNESHNLFLVPTQQPRLVNLPAQPVQQHQHHQQHQQQLHHQQQQQQQQQQGVQPQLNLEDKMISNSPSRPSILRRREGDPRDLSGMPDTPPPR